MKRAFYQKFVYPGLKRIRTLSMILFGLIVLLPDMSAADIITLHPEDVDECTGYIGDVIFKITAKEATAFQWQMWTGKEWLPIDRVWDAEWPRYGGNETNTFVIQFTEKLPLTTFWDGAAFRCVALYGKVPYPSNAAYINVLVAPGITSQPSSAKKLVGEDVKFSVSTTGSNPKTYQWQKLIGIDWVDITGETDVELIIKTLTLDDEGEYRVIVANACGSVTSKSASLDVVQPLKIVSHPVNVEECDDYVGNISFTVVAIGENITYQWEYDKGGGWLDMTGEVSDVLTITFKPANDGYAFRCEVTSKDTDERLYSNAAFQYVNHPPDITDDPDDLTKNDGESATFYITASGSAPMYYQWQVDEGAGWVNMDGEESSTYTIPSVTTSEDQNLYRCTVTNMCASTNSLSAKLTVLLPEYDDGWFKQNTIYSYDFIDVAPVSENDVWILTQETDLLMHSTNGGEDYSPVDIDKSIYGYCMDFTSATKGYVGGYNRYAFTDDGGSTWDQYWFRDSMGIDITETAYLRDIYFFDANIGFMVGDDGLIARTDDGGDNWTAQNWAKDLTTFPSPMTTSNLRTIFFINSSTGWAGGTNGKIVYTTNGGTLWTQVDAPESSDIMDIHFLDASNGIAIGSGYKDVFITADGGLHWTKYDEAKLPYFNPRTLHFTDALNGWMAGYAWESSVLVGRIMRTNDGGVTWHVQHVEDPDMLNSLVMLDSDHGWAVGAAGEIQRTAYGGCLTPTMSLYEDKFFCSGEEYIIIADTFQQNLNCTYEWQDASTEGYFVVDATGTYSVTATNLCGVTASDDINITFYDLPAANAGTDDTICNGETAQLLATGGELYSWNNAQYLSDPDLQNPIATPPIGTTSFIVYVTDANGCSQKDTVDIKVWPIPTSTFIAPSAVCGGADANIGYSGTASASASYTWGFDSGDIISGAGPGPYVISWNTIGTKTVSLFVERNECVSAETTKGISVFAIPVSDFSVQESVCGDGLVFVTYSGTDSTGADYMWDFSGGEIVTGSAEGPYQVKWNTIGVKDISLKVDENNCLDSTDHDMIVYAIPTSAFDAPEFVCGTDSAEITFTGSAADTANFFWNLDGGSGVPDMDPFKANWAILGFKTVSLVITEAGCESDTTKRVVSVNQVPTSDFEIQGAVCGSDTVLITYTGNATDTANYTWSFGKPAALAGAGQGPYHVIWDEEGIQVISLSVLDNNCYSDASEAELMVDFPYADLEICLVTIDIETGYNMVIWERPADDGIASFNVYRETSIQGQYDILENVPYGDLSVYVDMTSEPEKKSHKYRIALVDTCGNESDLSEYHKTMLLTSNLGSDRINLSWQEYEVEGGSFGFVKYLIYRGVTPSTLEVLDSIASDNVLYPDIDPPSDTMYYRIAGVKSSECAPAIIGGKKAGAGPYSHSISNLEDNRLQTSGLNDLMREKYQFNVYPNPFSEVTQLSYNLTEMSDVKVEVYNLLGARILELVSEHQSPGDYRYNLSAADIGSIEGIFYIRFTVGDKSMVKKVIMTR